MRTDQAYITTMTPVRVAIILLYVLNDGEKPCLLKKHIRPIPVQTMVLPRLPNFHCPPATSLHTPPSSLPLPLAYAHPKSFHVYLPKPLHTRLHRVKILHLQLPLNVYPWQKKPHNCMSTLPIQLQIPVTIDQSPLTNPFSVSLLCFAVSFHYSFVNVCVSGYPHVVGGKEILNSQ